MVLNQKIDAWLTRLLWHKSDTSETLEQKVYLVGNMIIPSVLISINLILAFILSRIQLALFIIAPLLLAISITGILVVIIKRGIKWFLYFYYGGYIILSCVLVVILGGLPNSCGVWGGAFICFMHALALKNKRVLVVNAFIYFVCLLVIVISFPYLIPVKEWTPKINNLYFTINEIWMCLFLVKSFYDSIILKTDEAKSKVAHLQELDLLKSRLYANIAHEFRTPLTLIRGNAEEIGGNYGSETFDKTTSIVHNSDKILFLVNQMLDLSKIEEGNVPLHYIQCDVIEYVRFIVGSFQGYAEMRKIGLHYQPAYSHLMMDIEMEKFEESLSNLISNAIKYTPEGGDVYVSLHLPYIAKTTQQQVEISVRDTGIGIPEDQLDKIFIRFYRIEDKRYPYQEGTGIGLTLVNEYLKLMNGSIRVSSSPDKGSEFVIVLPLTLNAEVGDIVTLKNTYSRNEDTATYKSGSIAYEFSHPRLLIIEDNTELIEYLKVFLEEEYQVLTAEDGIKGIDKAIVHIPDIILSDVMMPGKDGYQVCNELKNDIRTSHIPIILLTARADTDSRIQGLGIGADAYLTKPFNKKELKTCLHNLFVQRENLRLKFKADLFEMRTDKKDAGLDEKFMARVNKYLETNYKNDGYGINNLYTDMKISRVQLHRKLIALTGQAASNFIRSFRLQKARKLLLETNKNVTDIAFEVGFADANYFSKAFILEYGLTASEFRKSFR